VSARATSQSGERFLVTGAYGCIGAWTVAQLVSEGADVVALDLSNDPRRLGLVLAEHEIASIPRVSVDITDLDTLEGTIDEHGVTNIIHLAALQVPFCRADPPLGARVNVVGTVNVLEAVARRADRMAPLVYASSIATYEELEQDADRTATPFSGLPGTLYGVFKRANEGAAAVYARDGGLASIGLRPHTVYGPGRDQGLTSAPTAAMLAAAAGRKYLIPYGGRMQMQYAPDVARAFIAASRSRPAGASVHNLAGQSVHMRDVVEAIERAAPEASGLITFEETVLPFPEEVDAASLEGVLGPEPETELRDGVADTIARFRRLLAQGRVSAEAVAASPV
jgi:UDP-glucuronate 4-epimerase